MGLFDFLDGGVYMPIEKENRGMNFIDLLHRIWNKIKRIFVKCINFFKNIVDFFKTPARLRKLKEDKDLIAVSIKENLENGDYKVVDCLFDKETGEVKDYNDDALGMSAEDIDSRTEQSFGNKDMIILQ